MPRDRVKTLRSLARDERDAIQALAAHLPEPLRESLAPHRPPAWRRTDEAITRIFSAAEENRRAASAPRSDDRDGRAELRN